MKQLPADVKLSALETFVLAQPAAIFTAKAVGWLKLKLLLTSKKGIFMISTTFLATTTAIVLSTLPGKGNETGSTTQQPPALHEQQLVNPHAGLPEENFPEIATEEQLKKLGFSKEQITTPITPISEMLSDTTKKKKTVAVSNGNSVTIISTGDGDSESPMAVAISTDEEGRVSYAYSTDSIIPEITIAGKDNTITIVSDCGKGNDFEKIIEEELKKDGLIADVKKYSYEITDDSFSVNNKKQSGYQREKYLNLLLNNSCISLGDTFTFEYERNKNTVTISTDSNSD
ncbi:MAG: hypothetical protein ACKVPJ_08080 [Chitinophagales bacterium]